METKIIHVLASLTHEEICSSLHGETRKEELGLPMSSVHVQATTRIGTYNACTLTKQVQVASETYYNFYITSGAWNLRRQRERNWLCIKTFNNTYYDIA